ncbi:CoA transferase [Thermoactinospora rubra]|uniref:CoA transferase n=1 Tax=Thermoactinospora rubra TaxID=1088767 RepID=UPI001F0B43F4|nr:CoA transferase [Thermoactinospora rubra]
MTAAPLAGMRIVELSSFVAAPLGGMTLARLGAEVIRVDPAGGGPDRRRWPLGPGGESLYWAGLNQGKRSVTVDLASPEGRARVADLAVECGVLLTNARPRPGLTYEELRRRREDLIYVQLQGRRDGSAAVDYTVNAAGGFAVLTGPAELERPVNHVVPVWDVLTGLYLALAVLAADRRGGGAHVGVALEDVALATAGNLGLLAEAQLSRTPRPRIGNDLYGDFGRDFACADGARFMVVVLTERHWRDLVAVTGVGPAVEALEKALGADFRTGDDRYRHREVVAGLVAPWFAARTAREVEEALTAASVLWSRYRSFAELDLAGHPLFNRVGDYMAPGLPLVFDGVQAPAVPAPKLGEHNDEVLP